MRAKETRTSRGRLLKLPSVWKPLLDEKFERLKPVGFTGKITKHGQKMITCRCACGNYVDVMPASLRAGLTKSCGCLHTEVVAVKNVEAAIHGETVGGTLTPLYRVWQQIKQRCYNKNHDAYTDYGGRGIKMHPAWRRSFVVFAEDLRREIGEKPNRSYSLDRINNNRGYVPGNIRWALPTTQVRNRRMTKLYVLNGEARPLAEWARMAGRTYELVKNRILTYDWPLDEALGTDPGFGRCPLNERRKWNGRSHL